MTRTHWPLLANRFSLALALAGMAGGVAYSSLAPERALASVAAPPRVVQIHNFAFAPGVLTVSVGTTVTWRNGDEDPHTIVANDHSFRSGALSTNGAYSFTFRQPGAYVYFCSLHPHMVGRIVVRAS